MSPIAKVPVRDANGAVVLADVNFVDLEASSRLTAGLPEVTSQGRPLDDAIEFVHLAVKRWNYYYRSGYSVSGAKELRQRVGQNPHCEIGFMLAVVLPTGKIIGGCFARRTWAGNILLDFLFSHPASFTANGATQASGVGFAMMSVLASLALSIQADELWGEATENSHGFYKKIKSRLASSNASEATLDRFIFQRAELVLLAAQIS